MAVMKLNEIQIRDPFILKEGGLYHLFGSTDKDIWKGLGTGFDTYRSSDLTNWEGPEPAFRPPAGFWGTRDFWAPEVHKYKENFYMFASFIGEGYKRGTTILVSKDAEGPYIPLANGPLTPKEWMCLDGTFYLDKDSQPWMIFCHEWVQAVDGTICAIKLSQDLSHAISDPVELLKSTDAPYSTKVESPSNKVEGYVTDGPSIYTLSSGKLLMLWSCMSKNGYSIGYAVSDGGIAGPWRQESTPLFDRDGGHGMIFETYGGELLLAIHSPNDTPNERAMFVKLEETEDGVRLA
jgi:beta-xylosidase